MRCTHWLQLQPHIPVRLKIAACVLISYLFVIQVLFLNVEEGLETATPLLQKTQTREAKDKRRRRRVQQMHLRCMCGHVYLCALAETWECACGSVNVKVWCHCLHPPVGLLDKKSISSFAPQEPNRTRLRDNRRPVMSPDINGGSLTEMSGCDGSILKHRREAGVTWWGEGCWAIRDMSHIGHAGWFTIKIYYIPWGWNSHYLMLTCTGQPLNL